MGILEDGRRERSSFVGVILAAGRGTRMQPFGLSYPKPILPVCNKPLILHQIEMMKEIGIDEVVILIGHRGFEISKELGDGRTLGLQIRYVEQTEMLGIAHAVGRLESALDRPFILFLGDIFFIARDLREMFRVFREQGGGAVLATKEENDPAAIRKNFSVVLSEDGSVTRVIEKPRHAPNRLKGVGLYLFDLTIFDAIRRTPRTAMRDEYEITDSIQVFIDDGYPVRVANVIEDDVNLTTPADLLDVNLRRARLVDPSTLIGPDCRLHASARVENSVIGARVVVKNPISIRNSVVFPDTLLEASGPIEHSIVTPEVIVDCSRPALARGRGC